MLANSGIPWKLGVPAVVAALIIGVLGTWWATLSVPERPMYFEIELPEQVDFSRSPEASFRPLISKAQSTLVPSLLITRSPQKSS